MNYDSLTIDMKSKALPLLMFMVIKRSGGLKAHIYDNGIYQRVHADKDDVSSPIPNFYAFKCACVLIAKKERDLATMDLPCFFLESKVEGDERILQN